MQHKRCPDEAEFAINGRDRTILACAVHAVEPMRAIIGRDGIGVFWSTNGQCFARILPDDLPPHPTCSICGMARDQHPDSDHPWNTPKEASHA